jgi:hypothetical protein
LFMRVLNRKTNDNKMLCAFCFSLRTLRFQSTKPLTNANTLIIIYHTKKQTNINTSVQRKQNSIQTSVYLTASQCSTICKPTDASRPAPSAAASDFDFGTWGPLLQMPLSCSHWC